MNRKIFLQSFCAIGFFAFNVINGQSSQETLKNYYQKNGLLGSSNSAFIILNEDNSKSLGANIINTQQTYNGLRVYNALGKVIIKEGKIILEKNDFKKNIFITNQGNGKDQFSEDLLKQNLGLKNIVRVEYLPDVYFEKNNVFVLAKELFVTDKNSSDVWHVIADANTGEILTKDNLTVECNFEHSNGYKEQEKGSSPYVNSDLENQKISANSSLLVPSNASYNVFALPVEAPTFGGRSVLNNPWDLTASPEGWHFDGTNSYTNTRGNNVYAYSDQGNTNTPGYSPDGGSNRNFDFTYSEGRFVNPFTHRDAAITNLFYVNNKIHDVFYRFGFTESARNFQTNNFSSGGIGGDAVRAEASDGSGLNNANFSAGYETIISGQLFLLAPRMQMYLWDRAQTAADPIVRYQYNSPANVASRPKVMTGSASFGPLLFDGQSVTGNLAVASPADACTQPAAGSLTNKIAIVTSTSCEYGLKALNAQTAGAVGVIVYRPGSDTPVNMGPGTYGNQVTIPAINMGMTEGNFLVTEVNNGTAINTTLLNDFNGFKHSSLDNGIVIHEYGHGISNRLTGQGYSCLSASNSTEQMGEGWSDFFALMLTTRPGDTSALARGIGTYSADQATTGVGIRPQKYSPDFAINDYTYQATNSMTGNSHSTGFVWASTLWDLTWKYIEKYGYNSDVLADPNSGNARILQMVVNGLKLQACSPTFIDGRDAILQADMIATNGADKCMIWKAFAKRGLGVNASAGSKTVWTDQVEDFSFPQECNTVLGTEEIKTSETKYVVFPNPTYDEFFVGNIDKSKEEVKINVFDMSGKRILSDTREYTSKKGVSTKGLQKGVYMVVIKQGDKIQTEKLIVK
ncbi:T9SS C-terminal target domain-containing protein [Chryseobacterium nematophagum]|uniref:T9SS C-terminal target domain-containing protein n=1 Tax=Chryseobacterium nematophagum TaxID=2305228 RepID=A0A3M7LDK6_9FLAO|nr:T9SS-dependent M36 family metallopeptidase [Chryseobacterium nematophagum]RMZ60627.1 T9SS C-terminal target domain-containing protein [Chryseobacterium nematophagum]